MKSACAILATVVLEITFEFCDPNLNPLRY